MQQQDVESGPSEPHPELLIQLVNIWQRISSSTLHAIQSPPNISSNTFTKPKTFTEETAIKPCKRLKSMKTRKSHIEKHEPISIPPSVPLANGIAPALEVNHANRGVTCELCGGTYPHPVTKHMKMTHAGCGNSAGGKGYNSSGVWLGGWAGDCGDAGSPSSSWYLFCESCRERCIRQARGVQEIKVTSPPPQVPRASPLNSLATPMKVHQVLKENAMFLLRIGSSVGGRDVVEVVQGDGEQMIFEDLGVAFNCLRSLGHSKDEYARRVCEERLSEENIREIKRVVGGSGSGGGASRKRATSNENAGLMFVSQPSPTLKRLAKMVNEEKENGFPLNRPVFQFILQPHDLQLLLTNMKDSLCKAIIRTFAFRVSYEFFKPFLITFSFSSGFYMAIANSESSDHPP